MKSKVWDDLDLNALPFIDSEMTKEDFERNYLCTWDSGHDVTHQHKDDQRNIDEAIFQIKSCIASLEHNASRSNKREARDVIRVIQQNLKWEESEDLKHQVQLLQSLLYRG
ncbi:hypothetical protein [Acinetobacter sp. WU_MDCI_Abxc22]|uniref:hypothetical protein n=1 Tax=Acinetobacter sp. WU_MDCI_Abxc22 TaxID=2850071 RepID=UPI0021CD9E29|nr:hypothetical protein [Acinetobacter sp. WU_MDCI_Abxc22]MCU4361011.1 hypothetical protein [Acinetobacter sp. WU_MDCI_Abxc22]